MLYLVMANKRSKNEDKIYFSELISKIAEDAGFFARDVDLILQHFKMEIESSTMRKNKQIVWSGFGTFRKTKSGGLSFLPHRYKTHRPARGRDVLKNLKKGIEK